MKVVTRKGLIQDAATEWLEERKTRADTPEEAAFDAARRHAESGPITVEGVTEAILAMVNRPVTGLLCYECQSPVRQAVQFHPEVTVCRECVHRAAQEISRV